MVTFGTSFPQYDITSAPLDDLPEAMRQIQANFMDLALRTSGISAGFADTSDDVAILAYFFGFTRD